MAIAVKPSRSQHHGPWGTSGINGKPGSVGLPGVLGKITYHILGEDIEVDGPKDFDLTICLSTLNVLGKPFYDELKKNSISFPKEIEEFLKVKFRDLRIDDILDSQS